MKQYREEYDSCPRCGDLEAQVTDLEHENLSLTEKLEQCHSQLGDLESDLNYEKDAREAAECIAEDLRQELEAAQRELRFALKELAERGIR